MNLQPLWDRHYNVPVGRMWDAVDMADSLGVEAAAERAILMQQRAYERIKRETGYTDPAQEAAK